MFNKVTLMGRLTADPVERYTKSGLPYTTFALACERDYAGTDGERGVDFIDCVTWRKTADFVAKYFSKGRMMIADGALRQNRYTDKDGHQRSTCEVVVDRVYFGDRKNEAVGAPADIKFEDVSDDGGELPF